jgi:hypothetical protein
MRRSVQDCYSIALRARHALQVWLLNAIYEEDFLGFSYGFRPRLHEQVGRPDDMDATVAAHETGEGTSRGLNPPAARRT